MIKLVIILVCSVAISCSSSEKNSSKQNAPLENTRWVLKVLNDKKVFTPEGGKEIYIQFQKKDNRTNGYSGCNNFFGTYIISNDKLEFGPIATTEMFCEHQMETEKQFVKVLEQTRRYKIQGNTLYFNDINNLLAKFEASYLN